MALVPVDRWTVDTSTQRMRTDKFEALYNSAGSIYIARHRADVAGADNLGEELTLQVAASACNALRKVWSAL